jgi:hypothetical protein
VLLTADAGMDFGSGSHRYWQLVSAPPRPNMAQELFNTNGKTRHFCVPSLDAAGSPSYYAVQAISHFIYV